MKILLYLFLLAYAPNFWSSGITNACNIKIDNKEKVRIDDHMQGIWKMAEDSNAHDYLIVEKAGDYRYSVTYMNRGGDNRGLEHEEAFIIEVNNTKYFTISNWDRDYPGWVFLKLDSIGKGSWNITANLATDNRLKEVKDSKELRELLGANINNASFYGKELHFKKKYEFNSFGK